MLDQTNSLLNFLTEGFLLFILAVLENQLKTVLIMPPDLDLHCFQISTFTFFSLSSADCLINVVFFICFFFHFDDF